ncbi:hypothetical protein LTR10_020102 [Elasticomyces elasticus]|uniref:Uncharacterized protein n=1 Tax=Exophiala sideris TaxID=1016849 RepID=A0ABR0IVR4_9EURO|nr:hypothetical protein LTR10_020102 [Elasticomyces elasticus]KAK5021564.1 hypothetical protein LTS07_010861 [Exophiala sideris]KAK5049701.1 hypothetical protein LTR69_010885 [Exophiala sideris]KAK5176682.1 hypothetical protein LTR44_010752 [Eurotiomycetes sp. CCFEE 6388]
MIRVDRWWGQSTEVRKRGLRGGRARAQQAKKGKLAACLQDPTPEQNTHRQEVERKYGKGRNLIEGLRQILTMFEDSHHTNSLRANRAWLKK